MRKKKPEYDTEEMRKKQLGKATENTPDCGCCVLRKDCDNAQEGSFCTRFRLREVPDRGPGPAEKWALGEEFWE